jgi:hypothetical protein|tara:strand:+ start:1687 stop:2175 length:489 start_codon:yes stop_codon:yes gene_type:complete
VRVEDPRAKNSFEQVLGTLQINFNEGSNENTNTGIREDYTMYPVITNYFPPEEPPRGAFIPLLFAGALVGLFSLFLIQSFFGSAMDKVSLFGNLSAWGFLLVVNYLGIYAIIVAFWVKINLINTLWTILAIALPTLFLMNKGLTPDGCHVSGFSKALKAKNN